MAAVRIREAAPAGEPGDLRFGIPLLEKAGDMAGECREHRPHPERTLPLQDLLLELHLAVDPALRKRTVEGVDVVHAVPGEVGRAGKIGPDLLVREAVAPPDLLPDSLLSGDGEGHVHPVEGHPVDHPLPIFPFPPGHRVAEGAVIQEETVLHAGRTGHRRRNGRHLRGHFNAVRGIPRHGRQAVIPEEAVEADRHGKRIIPLDHQILPFRREGILLFRLRRFHETDAGGIGGDNAAGEAGRGLFSRRAARRHRQDHRQKEG